MMQFEKTSKFSGKVLKYEVDESLPPQFLQELHDTIEKEVRIEDLRMFLSLLLKDPTEATNLATILEPVVDFELLYMSKENAKVD